MAAQYKACLAIVVLLAVSINGQTLLQTPVPGRLSLSPTKTLSGAIVVPPLNTAYLSGAVGGNATDIETQTKTALNSLKKTLTTLGSTMDAVVKTTIFLADIEEFALMNSVYSTYWNSTPPARSTVEVAALVGGTRIEIDFVAVDAAFGKLTATN